MDTKHCSKQDANAFGGDDVTSYLFKKRRTKCEAANFKGSQTGLLAQKLTTVSSGANLASSVPTFWKCQEKFYGK